MSQEQSPIGARKEVTRTLRALSRAARASRLYAADNVGLQRMISELTEAVGELLDVFEELTIKVRPECFIFEDQRVLEEPNPDDSVPFAFFRDGIRRIVLYRGIETREIELLLRAIASSLTGGGIGLGDDIVSYLWRHDLDHVTYLVVDTTVVDADSASALPASGDDGPVDVDAQIDGLLVEIYGASSTDDAGPRSLHLDETDIPARAIAESIEALDAAAAGLSPARRLRDPPVYVQALHDELEAHDDRAIAKRASDVALAALAGDLAPAELTDLLDGLLTIFDAAVLDRNVSLARRIVDGVRRRREGAPVRKWIDAVCTEARLRSLVTLGGGAADIELLALVDAVGPPAVPALLAMLSGFADRSQRRVVADLVVQAGVTDVEPISAMIKSEQPFVVIDLVEILSRTRDEGARVRLAATSRHENPAVRVAVLERVLSLSLDQAHEVATDMLYDAEPTVRVAAAEALANSANRDLTDAGEELVRRMRAKDACAVIEAAVESLDSGQTPLEVKVAFMKAYARLHHLRAHELLAKTLKRGEGLLANKRNEDMAIAALHGLAIQPTPRAKELVARTAKGRQRRLREVARQLIEDGA